MAPSNIETEHALPEAPTANRSNGAVVTHDYSKVSSQEHTKEIACGITEFTAAVDTASKSHRYTDFLVNEILPSGEVVHLTNLKVPTREPKHGSYNDTKPATSKTQSHVASPGQGSVTIKHEAVDQTPEQTLTPVKEHGPRIEHEQNPHSVELEASEYGTDESLSPVKQAESHTGTSLDTAQPASESNLPLPKPDVDQTESVSPHKRILPPSPAVQPNMQSPDGMQSETPTRKKQKVLIRQTSEGWVEVEQEKENELREKKDAEDAAGAVKAEESCPEPPVNEKAQPAQVKYEPKASTQAQWQAFAGAHSAASMATGFKLNSEDRNLLTTYFGSKTVDALVALYERIVNSPHRKAKDYGIVKTVAIGRETRSKIHQDIRKIFNSRFESVTDNSGSMVITAMPEKPTFYARTPVNNDRNRERNQKQWNRPSWEELGGEYLHFTLLKENKDTMESISWLAKELKMKPGSFQFAGTKDRRAVTVQRVSVYRVLADRMVGAGRTLRNARIGNFEHRPFALQLGELSGNEFVVTLRDCDFHYPLAMDSKTIVEGARSIIGASIKQLRERGFINYYGLQRFGTFFTSTSEIGVRMLQGDFKAAVNAILHFAPASLIAAQDPTSMEDKVSRDDQARAHALHAFKTTGNANLYDLPRKFSAETSIIRHLSKRGQSNDYLGALQNVQRNLRLMYVHAYQSLVWNMAASERWKRFGSTVIEGDLVLVDEHADKTETIIKKEEVDEDGEAIIHPSAEDRATDPEDMFTRARPLSKEEAESGRYTIFDVVLPTPGYDILYPANQMEKFYEDFMGSERGGGLNPHDMRRKWKDVSLSGSYRKLLARPGEDISFEIRVYNDDDEQFVETDLDCLGKGSPVNANGFQENAATSESKAMKMGEKHTNSPKDAISSPKSEFSDIEPGGVKLSGGVYKDFKIAAVLKFQLGTSQYATIALRELMKFGGVKVHKPDFGGGR